MNLTALKPAFFVTVLWAHGVEVSQLRRSGFHLNASKIVQIPSARAELWTSIYQLNSWISLGILTGKHAEPVRVLTSKAYAICYSVCCGAQSSLPNPSNFTVIKIFGRRVRSLFKVLQKPWKKNDQACSGLPGGFCGLCRLPNIPNREFFGAQFAVPNCCPKSQQKSEKRRLLV